MDMTLNQSDLSDTSPIENPRPQLRVQASLETLVYIGIFLFAAFIRIIELGTPTLNNAQAHEALAALRRVSTTVVGEPIVANSPLMAFFNQLAFFFLGSDNTVARLATALAGLALVMSPLLLREVWGRITTLSLVALLAVSPVAIISARTMGAVTWTMLLVFVGGWCLLRYVDTRDKSYGVAVILVGVSIVLLSEASGLITLIGVLIGLFLAMRGMDEEDDENETVVNRFSQGLSGLPWGEGLLAGLGLVLVVGTGLFTASGGLTSVGTVLYQLGDEIMNRPANVPFAYALLVAFRYETIILLLGLVMLYPAWRDGTFSDRFFAGWFGWSLIASLLYANPEPSAALWLVIPATGLTASLISRMLRPASSGFWIVPEWAMPLQAIVSLSLLIALAVNFNFMARVMQEEAHALGIERIESTVMLRAGKLGAVTAAIPETTLQLSVPSLAPVATDATLETETAPDPNVLPSPEDIVKLTVQVVAITNGFEPELYVTNSQGEVLFGPFDYAGGNRGTVEELELIRGQDYFFKIRHAGDSVPETDYQFMLITHNPDGQFTSIFLDVPLLTMLARITPTAPLSPAILIPFLLILWLVLYLLFASLWGNRAAWRGLAFGLILYSVGAGLGMGWQGSVTFADDVRELWYVEAPTTQYADLAQTLEFLALQQSGEPDKMPVTVQGEDDTALAWLLRDFDYINYVSQTNFEITSPVVIIPVDQADPQLGADYIGQDFVLSETWRVQDLSWTDMGAWLTVRQSRLAKQPDYHVNLWVRKDVYGVDLIPEG